MHLLTLNSIHSLGCVTSAVSCDINQMAFDKYPRGKSQCTNNIFSQQLKQLAFNYYTAVHQLCVSCLNPTRETNNPKWILINKINSSLRLEVELSEASISFISVVLCCICLYFLYNALSLFKTESAQFSLRETVGL